MSCASEPPSASAHLSTRSEQKLARSSACNAPSEWCSQYRPAPPIGHGPSSHKAWMNTGITGAPELAAAYSAGLSATRRSFRNQTSTGRTRPARCAAAPLGCWAAVAMLPAAAVAPEASATTGERARGSAPRAGARSACAQTHHRRCRPAVATRGAQDPSWQSGRAATPPPGAVLGRAGRGAAQLSGAVLARRVPTGKALAPERGVI
eukprot:CAMPEP_0180096916 /NCGR_PEP_ID=MMETSP0985-20121206/26954_1 /TAXON_ID=483367 /ORGANISM="non described non described, Strain CCMP 2436" /LENGTH=206 /DNA_ID=CAMNT_0022032285 /DNA_START=297 /DNA_END=918 /DNA_ORIENTATION=-